MGATLAGCLLMTSAASAAPRGDAAQEHRALLPGQEALVMTMLGASEGMDDCALEGASIERATISARYRCEALPELVTIELSPRRATERGTTTALFTLHASDTAPPSLVEALASRVRLDERSLRFAGATWQRMEPRHASHARFAFAAMFFGLLALALALEVGALRATPPVLGLALALATLSLLAPFIAGSLDTALAPDAARLPRALVGASLIARLIYLAHRRRDPAITARVDTRVAEMSGAERYEPIVFALCTLLVLFFVADTRAPLHLDTARDLLIARDCVEGTWCEHAGPMTSFGGLVQGALWSHVLESHRAFGASMGALETMVVVVLALSAALVALTARHGFGLKPSVTLFSLWLALTLFVIDHPTLWNPTMTPLTLAALHLAFVRGLRTGGTLAFTFAAMALALSMELHVAFAIFLPVFLCASVACANAPFAAAP